MNSVIESSTVYKYSHSYVLVLRDSKISLIIFSLRIFYSSAVLSAFWAFVYSSVFCLRYPYVRVSPYTKYEGASSEATGACLRVVQVW